MSTSEKPPEPWHAFFTDLDHAVTSPVGLDCIGGFVVTQFYGLSRATADIDFIELASKDERKLIMTLGGRGGKLHEKHHVYLDLVNVAAYPENYGERLTQMYKGIYKHLHLLALDPYDLALTKLERNSQKDRDDVRYLAKTTPFDLKILEERYCEEMRWQLGRPDREDLTLKFWFEMIEEDRAETHHA
jgi:hypothetical protein